MALARVVTFDGVGRERMEQLTAEMEQGGPPEGFPPSELVILHDPDAEKAVAVVFFENEEDYRRGHEILDSMPADNTPGSRTSVTKYHVAARMSS